MALEEALNRNSDLLVEHNELLRQVLTKAGVGGVKADAADGEAKKGRGGRGKASDETTTGTTTTDDTTSTTAAVTPRLTRDALKAKLAAWLGEFKADESDPETDERRAKMSAVFEKLGVKKLDEIAETDGDKINRLDDWLETKAKPKGRFTPAPQPADTKPAADDLDI